MKRVNLSIESELFDKLNAVAQSKILTVNQLIIKILEGLDYDEVPGNKNAFDFDNGLEKIIKELNKFPDKKEFTLVELESFSCIEVSKAEKGYVQPSTIRARLGRNFNAAVREKKVPFVKRVKAVDKAGNIVLKFRNRAAVYLIDRSLADV